MALINCPECGNGVSDKAKMCPKCGVAINDSSTNTHKWGKLIGFGCMAVGVWLFNVSDYATSQHGVELMIIGFLIFIFARFFD